MVNMCDDGEIAYAVGGESIGSEGCVLVGDELGVFLRRCGIEGCYCSTYFYVRGGDWGERTDEDGKS